MSRVSREFIFRCKTNTVATRTRHPRPETGHFPGFFSIWYFWIPDQDTKIDKEQLFSTSWKYCLWYKARTKLHLHSIYCICLNGWILFLTIWLNYSVKSAMTPKYFFMFYDNNIHVLLYTFEKFRLHLNARSFLLSKMCQKVAKRRFPDSSC